MEELILSMLNLSNRLLNKEVTWSQFKHAILRHELRAGAIHCSTPTITPVFKECLGALSSFATAAFLSEKSSDDANVFGTVLLRLGMNTTLGIFNAKFFDSIGKNE